MPGKYKLLEDSSCGKSLGDATRNLAAVVELYARIARNALWHAVVKCLRQTRLICEEPMPLIADFSKNGLVIRNKESRELYFQREVLEFYHVSQRKAFHIILELQ